MQGGVGAEADVQAAEAQFAAAHKALLKTPGLQFEFKSGNETPRPREPSWLDGLDEFVTAAGPVLEVLFWGGLIIGGLFVVYFILREFAPDSWFRRNRIVTEVTDWRPEAAKAQALLEDADALAAAGRFEEAIHILLFRSIDDLVSRRPGAVRPALTSRDIAELPMLPDQARQAFLRLAQAVERTFFGGRPADADAFGQARADYQAFAFAEGWR